MKNGYSHNIETTLMFLTGFTAGSAAALLLAPQKGRQTRRQITRGVEDAQDYIAGLGDDLNEKGHELVRQGRKYGVRGFARKAARQQETH